MSWEELYPIVQEQAKYAVLRYDPRRKDKIQELLCQSYEKFTRDKAAHKKIEKQDYKCFVTQRAKEVDLRSFCKKGMGGTSTLDALSFYRRRPDVDTEVVELDEWMTMKPSGKEAVENQLTFNIDFKDWQQTLTKEEKTILSHLMQGYKASKIAEILKLSYHTVKTIISKLKKAFLDYFRLEEFAYP
jgi:ATP/maltotriose-dependent transcriptional regulator MalT